jgi:mannose-1-phosphate guanylyltransferase/phosphomannomutase
LRIVKLRHIHKKLLEVMQMKAVIMAGGEGTRLRPLTCGLPKPMVPILDKPVMEHILNHLKSFEIDDVAVTMAYMPSVIMDYFGSGADWGLHINYYIEEIPLGTGGSVLNAQDFLDDTFVIISGDALTDIDLQEAISFHKQKKSKATLVLKKVDTPLEYGVIITDEEGKIVRFLEKPSWGEVFSDTINTGIYVLEPEVLNHYKKGDNFDFSKDLFPKLLRDGVPMYGYVSQNYWNDIGDLKVYKEVNFDILEGKVQIKHPYKKLSQGIWVGSNCSIDSTCVLKSPVFIGDNCTIKGNTIISETIVGSDCEIDANTSLKKSIIWKNSVIQNNVQCRGAVLCDGVRVKKGASIFENSVVGSKTTLSAGSTVKPDVKIWPGKNIEEGAVVNQSLIWGTKVAKTLFGFKDISGELNTEITPEFASRLASAFGSTFRDGAKVVISTDNSPGALAVKEAANAGMLTTGVQLLDIGSGAMPINRYAVKFHRADGGLHIRMDNEKENFNRIHIELIDKSGANIDRAYERKIENVFVREDFKRCSCDKIKTVQHMEGFVEYYLQNCTNQLKNLNTIRSVKPKVVVTSKSQHTLFLAAAYLEKIGCVIQLEYQYFDSKRYKDSKEASQRYTTHIAGRVVRDHASLGVIFSEDGESVVLIDNTGKIIDKNKYLALSSLIIMNTSEDRKLIVPYNATSAIDTMAGSFNCEVVRTKNVPAELMKEMMKNEGTAIPLQYVMSFDAIWSIGILMDYLISKALNLSDLVSMLPDFYMEKGEVDCDWKHKGRLIREFIEENKNNPIELFEGVKINDEKGWVLILPDSEKPICNIYTEGYSEEYAKELCDAYSGRIADLVKRFEEKE